MTILDIIVLFLVGGGAVLGAIRGFTTEVIALSAWIATIAALKLFHGTVALMMGGGAGASVLAFLMLAGVTFFGVKLAAGALGGTVKRSALGGLDRGLGLGFGALKGLLIATLGFLLFTIGHDLLFGGGNRPMWMRTSHSFTLLEASSRGIIDFVETRRKSGTTPAKSPS